MQDFSTFARTIFQERYAHDTPDGKETWEQTAARVAKHVLAAVDAPQDLVDRVAVAIAERRFIPAGRYLYSSGHDYHQVNNCLLLKAEDTREGWGELVQKAMVAQMTGAGIGVDYSELRAEGAPLKRSGGWSSGPIALAQAVNELGRAAKQGGNRRGAIWAGLNWKHPDIFKFISSKDWSADIRALKAKDFNQPATLDYTNISVQLDDEFFAAYRNEHHGLHQHARAVYWDVIRHMLETGEPGFSIDCGENAGETLRNAPVCAETRVLTHEGYKTVGELVGVPTTLWTGARWAEDCVFEKTGSMVPTVQVEMSNGVSIRCDPTHEFLTTTIDRSRIGNAYTYTDVTNVAAKDLTPGTVIARGVSGIVHPVVSDHVRAWELHQRTFDDAGSYVSVIAVRDDEPADVYCTNVGYDEHSFMAEGVLISNCTEITSRDDSDVCNLGSINVARIESLDQMRETVELATTFLLAGTLYSHVPYEKVREVRAKNRRLGLGIMGVHEWLLARGRKYGPDAELAEYLDIYATSGDIANRLADEWGISRPVKTRSLQPTGTTSIVAETTSGIEPIFSAAHRRRYRVGDEWRVQYVLDPVAKRLVESGIDPDDIEDAYSLAGDIERRVVTQAWLQRWVDHGISSTINLPAWGSTENNESRVEEFGDMLMQYLPYLRGITVYPDGARGGQPLEAVPYREAAMYEGQTIIEAGDVCDLRTGESCGS
jgi:ribonucleotide reductase alpha subunit